jgi:hypothetical protein
MTALDKKEDLVPSNAKSYEYLIPTLLSMKENEPDAILNHLEKLSPPNIAKFLAVHARWSERLVFDKLLTKASAKVNDRINLKEFIFNQLLTPFTSYFIPSPTIFEKEAKKWETILLNDLDYLRFNPRTSLLFMMNQIITKKDTSEYLIPVINKLLLYAPYAMNTISYGLWFHGLKEGLQLLKSHNFQFFSTGSNGSTEIHSKIIFIITGLIDCNEGFLNQLEEQPLPKEIPDNFYKFFNIGIFYRQKDNDLKSNRFFEIAKELNPQTYSNIFPKIPNS